VAAYYYEHISNPLIELPERLPDAQNVYHLFPILVKNSFPSGRDGVGSLRDALHDYLAEKGIGTVIHYPIAPHKQECYANEPWNLPQLSLPITEFLADAELSLPISPCMTPEQMAYVVDCLNQFE
jgi:dTDP-4-amino-4,6-dideoxygalactose transaminase